MLNDEPSLHVRAGRTLSVANAIACGALLAFAFVAAPHSCEWGLSAYVWVGVVLLIAIAVATFFALRASIGAALVSIVLQSAAIGGTWLAGLFLADVRILCRLF